MNVINNSVFNPEEIDYLIKILNSKTSIKFHNYKKQFLQKRINNRLKTLKLDSIKKYINYIESNPDEKNSFLEKFTVNYTHFFRNFEIFEKAGEYIQTYRDCQHDMIKIWSAACASGEEPYSFAIFLEEFKEKHNYSFDYKIIASDIDKSALYTAKKGIYDDYAFYEVPDHYILTYFKENTVDNKKTYLINEKIKEKVEFIEEDIIKGHSRTINYDIILCRNLIIYLNDGAVKKIMKIINNHLNDQGLLILGKTEKVSSLKNVFKIYDIGNHIYIKDNHINEKDIKDYERDSIGEKIIQENDKHLIKLTENKFNFTNKNINKEKNEPDQKENKRDIVNPVENKAKEFQYSQIQKNFDKQNILMADLKDLNKINPSPTEKPYEAKSLESQFNEIDLKFKQIKLLEEQLSLLEKQLNRRKKQSALLDSQISLRENDLKKKKKLVIKKEKKLSIRKKNIELKISELEQFEKQIDKKMRYLEKLETITNKKILNLESFEQQLDQRSLQIDINEKEKITNKKNNVQLNFKKIIKPNFKREIVLSEGYYSSINLKNKNIYANKFAIYGVKSSIVVILEDKDNKLYGIIHFLAPWTNQSINPTKAVKNYYKKIILKLTEELLNNGAAENNLKAYILGGAKDLNREYTHIKKSLTLIKDTLRSIQISIKKEDIGGFSKRSILFEFNTESLLIKKSWEIYFRRIN